MATPVTDIITSGLWFWYKCDEVGPFDYPVDYSGNGYDVDAVWGWGLYEQGVPPGVTPGAFNTRMISAPDVPRGFYTLYDANTPASDAADMSYAEWCKIENMTVDSVDNDDPDILLIATGDFFVNGFRFWFGSINDGAVTDSLRFTSQVDGATESASAVYDFGVSVDTLGWMHVGFSYDHSTRQVKLYLNGTNVVTHTVTTAVVDVGGNYNVHGDYLGTGGDAGYDYYFGDKVLGTTVWTDAQFQQLYERALANPPAAQRFYMMTRGN